MLFLDDRRSAPASPNLEVLTFDDALRARDFSPNDGMSIGRSDFSGRKRAGIRRLDPVSHQQVVLEAHEEPRLPGIALTPGAAPELKVDAPALVPVRADDIEAAERRDRVAVRSVCAAEPDVGASAGHVRGDGDRPDRARARR